MMKLSSPIILASTVAAAVILVLANPQKVRDAIHLGRLLAENPRNDKARSE